MWHALSKEAKGVHSGYAPGAGFALLAFAALATAGWVVACLLSIVTFIERKRWRCYGELLDPASV